MVPLLKSPSKEISLCDGKESSRDLGSWFAFYSEEDKDRLDCKAESHCQNTYVFNTLFPKKECLLIPLQYQCSLWRRENKQHAKCQNFQIKLFQINFQIKALPQVTKHFAT